LKDKGIDFAEGLLKKEWNSPDLFKIQNILEGLTPLQRKLLLMLILLDK
jgi:hypothetical protein